LRLLAFFRLRRAGQRTGRSRKIFAAPSNQLNLLPPRGD
jgi:hypothetical protein